MYLSKGAFLDLTFGSTIKDQVHQYQTEDIEALQAYPNSVLVEPLGQRLRSVFFKALQHQASVDA